MIILDVVIAILLVVSIGYSWQLNKKITDFRNSKSEFTLLIKTLDEAIIRAEVGIDELKALSTQATIELNSQIEKAKFLADDLAFMGDRATLLVDKLERNITEARQYEKSNYVELYKQQLAAYQPAPVEIKEKKAPLTNNPSLKHLNTEPITNSLNLADGAEKKMAIESLLARISAARVPKKETIDG